MTLLKKKTSNTYASKYELAEVKQGLDALTGSVQNVADTLNSLKESFKGAEKTPAQKQEMTEKQLADALEIQKRPNRAIPVFGEYTEKVDEDFLIKGITPGMPDKEAQDTFYEALKSPTDSDKMIEFQRRCDRIKMKCQLLDKRPSELKEYKGFQAFLEKTGFDDVVKVITTGTTTDFVPEGWSNEVQKYYYLALKVTMLFNEFTMPQNPFRWDLIGRGARTSACRTDSNGAGYGCE